MKKASGLYGKVAACQPNFKNYSKSESDMLVEMDIVGSSFLRVRRLPHENHISRFIRTYGCMNGLTQVVFIGSQSCAAHESQGSLIGYI